jgi:hypothetical protein
MGTPNIVIRRTLHFDAIEQAIADVQELYAADQRGTLRCLGRWTFGQNLNHLAKWIDFSYDGVPLRLPFFVPWIMRFGKNQFLHKPMKPGSRIPGLKDGTLGTEVLSSQEGVAYFEKNFSRLAKAPPDRPHVLLGPLTHDEWIAQHLRHAELHLSFLRAE